MNDKELRAMIKRFMAGKTTIEEEKRLSEHFTRNEVSEEFAPYKEMFKWFSNGMPLENAKPKLNVEPTNDLKRGSKRTHIALLIATAAAAIALLLVTTLTQNSEQQQMLPPTGEHPITANNSATADTLTADTTHEETQKPMKKRRKHKQNPYILPHPTTLMAQAKRDSINMVANKMAEERLRQINREQAFKLNIIDEQFNGQSKKIELIMAALDDDAYYYDDEEIEAQ